ncbi:heat-inducible transcriptional repressor HrcA [Microbacterium sp. CFBP9023]|uniref:heat-inducible transcriptional repressor HrcA n=1 Tax=Microbacterium TaxID=33882 RepID=UPI00069E3429|nr:MULTISPECIES: heat-inducible transcriptional repressor HrcA [unclassified Microbacterium]AKV85825.1 HrcA family transcriptional regulator [Microbacterium sp. CGR1]KRD52442.1 HrcA family transcriptional regulator [Microbacterium sp. Root280D1]MBC6494945.1 heat-inducible transcriptional repressor HrcA [Microbacterium sp. 4-7]MDY0983099.1 heat-inducible transcriptional repressor HrcA [Microbacterium sp. CFBP9023]CAH0182065.1 Heat-inducible transcription repressor HrcA [Microbacterium sp. Bi98]
MVSERGLQVLRAIVQDYVETHEPVGSRSIVDRYSFGVSAATIRNDMALLEDEELIAAPHTSSGRVPTDKGYRVFVDHLAQLRPLSVAQRTAIESFLTAPSDLDDLMVRTVRVLTQLTGQVALAQYPSFARAHLTHLELVALAPNRLLIVLVTDAGGVSQRIAPLPVDVDDADMALLRARLSALITGRAVSDAAERLQALLADDAHSHDVVLRALATIVIDELGAFRQERLVMAGAATLARREQDFRGSIHPLLEAIEEQVTLLRLMSEMEADSHGLAASIGTENASFGLGEASIVASNYAAPSGTARVGVMGPTRMDYPSNLAAARAVARYLSRMLDEDEAAR